MYCIHGFESLNFLNLSCTPGLLAIHCLRISSPVKPLYRMAVAGTSDAVGVKNQTTNGLECCLVDQEVQDTDCLCNSKM
jgi:hypothetical protein